jgi:spore germination cell wall hydrolase CwlJ-like protein
MKKFVTLFLLLVLSTSTFAQETIAPIQAAETQVEVVMEAPQAPVIEEPVVDTTARDVSSETETFAIDITDHVATTVELPTEADIRCMQENIYFEARAEGEKGMIAVAEVTVNRTRHDNYPPTVCGVVYEQKRKGTCQFSWTCDKRPNSPRLKKPEELAAWEKCGEVARLVLSGTFDAVVGQRATHYHATYVKPKWSRHLDRIVRIGRHIFYRE